MKIKYIYNYVQADYFIKNGAVCIGTGFNAKSSHYYWEFDKNDDRTQKCYDLWLVQKHNVLDSVKWHIKLMHSLKNLLNC